MLEASPARPSPSESESPMKSALAYGSRRSCGRGRCSACVPRGAMPARSGTARKGAPTGGGDHKGGRSGAHCLARQHPPRRVVCALIQLGPALALTGRDVRTCGGNAKPPDAPMPRCAVPCRSVDRTGPDRSHRAPLRRIARRCVASRARCTACHAALRHTVFGWLRRGSMGQRSGGGCASASRREATAAMRRGNEPAAGAGPAQQGAALARLSRVPARHRECAARWCR